MSQDRDSEAGHIREWRRHAGRALFGRSPTFVADTASLEIFRKDVGIGKVVEVPSVEAALLAPHLEAHPETLFVAASGIDLSAMDGTLLVAGRAVAVEWIRCESRPRPGEPELNTYRWIFGLTADDRCLGYEAWDLRSTADNHQVGDHWTTVEEVCARYLNDDGH